MPRKPAAPCPEPGCPATVDGGGRCPNHSRAERARYPRHRPGAGWAKRRQRILERDGWTCQRCGAPATEVDHILGLRLFENTSKGRRVADDDGNLQALCKPCHSAKTATEVGLGAIPPRG